MHGKKKNKLCIWFVMYTFGYLCIKLIDVIADVKQSAIKLAAFHISFSAPSENKHLHILIHTVCCELFGFQQESGRHRLCDCSGTSWSINLTPKGLMALSFHGERFPSRSGVMYPTGIAGRALRGCCGRQGGGDWRGGGLSSRLC